MNTVKVRVYEITSVTDRETGKPGKNIKLVQVKQQQPQSQRSFYGGGFGAPDDTAMIKNIMSSLQQAGFPFAAEVIQPKINLFLSEVEYDLLGVRFEVNEIYDMILRDGTIRFQKPSEGV